MRPNAPPPAPPAGLLRRLAAMIYDALLLFGVLCGASALAIGLTVAAMGSAAFTAHNPLPDSLVFRLYLLLVCFGFYGWFWTHGGQTLGMRAWKIRIQDRSGAPVAWSQALRRFLAALFSWLCLGLGFLWMLVDRERLTWPDRFSATVLVLNPLPSPPPS
ncbi:MAG: RDD family protein [Pseudomonadota bacterium]|nr:RDD family protein [Pseudomonadota bacterium]